MYAYLLGKNMPSSQIQIKHFAAKLEDEKN